MVDKNDKKTLTLGSGSKGVVRDRILSVTDSKTGSSTKVEFKSKKRNVGNESEGFLGDKKVGTVSVDHEHVRQQKILTVVAENSRNKVSNFKNSNAVDKSINAHLFTGNDSNNENITENIPEKITIDDNIVSVAVDEVESAHEEQPRENSFDNFEHEVTAKSDENSSNLEIQNDDMQKETKTSTVEKIISDVENTVSQADEIGSLHLKNKGQEKNSIEAHKGKNKEKSEKANSVIDIVDILQSNKPLPLLFNNSSIIGNNDVLIKSHEYGKSSDSGKAKVNSEHKSKNTTSVDSVKKRSANHISETVSKLYSKEAEKIQKDLEEEKKGKLKKAKLAGHHEKWNSSKVMQEIDSDLSDNFSPAKAIQRRKSSSFKKKGKRDKIEYAKSTVSALSIDRRYTISEFSQLLGIKRNVVLSQAKELDNSIENENYTLSVDQMELLGINFDCKIKFGADFQRYRDFKSIDSSSRSVSENMENRAPVVVVMGHVDHGKTSLLDVIRNTNKVDTEVGRITQHIGAYQVHVPDEDSNSLITFIDTPGHEAFAAIRARGASVTDIVILVVAADDGIKDQTIEAIEHSLKAKVPIIVAINKIDKPDENSVRIIGELAKHGVIADEYGGDVIVVKVSAKTHYNIDELLKSILVTAKFMDLKADPSLSATGVVLEANVEKSMGVTVNVIVQSGTLKKGDIVIIDGQYAKVRLLVNCDGKTVDSALPSTPVKIFGFKNIVSVGAKFYVVESEKVAKSIIKEFEIEQAENSNEDKHVLSMDDMFKSQESKKIVVNIVVKADYMGSLEAVTQSLDAMDRDEIKINVVHASTGEITLSDINIAEVSQAQILGFGSNVTVSQSIATLAKSKDITIKIYPLIYDLIEDLKEYLSGKLEPVRVEKMVSRCLVKEIFDKTKSGVVIGAFVSMGIVKKGASVKAKDFKTGNIIAEGVIKALRRFKDEVKEVGNSLECGMLLPADFTMLKPNDELEIYEITYEIRKYE